MKECMAVIVFCLIISCIAVQAAEDVAVKSLLDIEIADWNKDGFMDKAVLVSPDNEDDDSAVLYIYLSDGADGMIIEKENIAWTGAMWGTLPELSVNGSGSLRIHSMNESIGRSRWHQILTVSYRNKEFIVSGYSYSSYDTLQGKIHFDCDVNFLNGRGEINGKFFRITVKKRHLQTWSETQIPKECIP